jgi:uncharacterized membrane protein YfcA
MIFRGIPATVANATNRIAIVLQTSVATGGYAQKRKLDTRTALLLAIPAAIGSAVGAVAASRVSNRGMEVAILCVMIGMLALLFVRPKRWLEGKASPSRRLTLSQFVLFFLIGIYGGFVQAGVGVLLLSALVLGAGFNLIRGNAVKVVIILIQAGVSLLVFSRGESVAWLIGLILACGNMTGALLATRLADRPWAARFVRWLLIVVVLASAIRLAWSLLAGA